MSIFFKRKCYFPDILKQTIPKTEMANKKNLKEFNGDCLADQLRWKSDIDPDTWPDPEITYTFNEYGYRCPSFETPGIKVMTIGCSNAFGLCVPESERCSHLFCKRLQQEVNQPVVDLNLAWPAVSLDYITRMALTVVPVLKPRILLIDAPCFRRSEYVDCLGSLHHYFPVMDSAAIPCLAKREIYEHKQELANQWEGLRKFQTLHNSIKLLAEYHNIAWMYAIKKEDIRYFNASKLFLKHLRITPWSFETTARDKCHPSKESHSLHAKYFWYKFQSAYPEVIKDMLQCAEKEHDDNSSDL